MIVGHYARAKAMANEGRPTTAMAGSYNKFLHLPHERHVSLKFKDLIVLVAADKADVVIVGANVAGHFFIAAVPAVL